MKDYDMSDLYHLVWANVVANSLSDMIMYSISYLDETKKDLAREVHRLVR